MITGDNERTVQSIATEAGVDDVPAGATPEDKRALIRREQEGGRLVAMTGDGTSDAPALAQDDVGVAMDTGTTAAEEAGNMVDLDLAPNPLRTSGVLRAPAFLIVSLRSRVRATPVASGHLRPVSALFGVAGRRPLDGLGLPKPFAADVAAALRLFGVLDVETDACEAALRADGAEHRYVATRMPTPGIGPVLSCIIPPGDVSCSWTSRKLGLPQPGPVGGSVRWSGPARVVGRERPGR